MLQTVPLRDGPRPNLRLHRLLRKTLIQYNRAAKVVPHGTNKICLPPIDSNSDHNALRYCRSAGYDRARLTNERGASLRCRASLRICILWHVDVSVRRSAAIASLEQQVDEPRYTQLFHGVDPGNWRAFPLLHFH